MRFELYLESGPLHRKTWASAPGLPGCVAFGATTQAALENARLAIRERTAFLRRHGEDVADPEPIELVVAGHTVGGKALGFGMGTLPFDLEPLSPDEARRLLRWADWSRQELVEAARSQSIPLTVRPAPGGRSAAAILAHVAGAEWAYVSSTLGTVPGHAAAIRAIEAAGEAPWDALAAERAVLVARLEAMTDEERRRVVERGERAARSARRMFRRLLEHEWEHTLELRGRLDR